MVRVNEKSSMRSYAFGPRVLRSDWLSGQEGRGAHLPPKELAVLRQLLAANGALISKDTLLEKVWPGSDVAEESLTRCIYSLRKLLGDNKDYIATVYGKGYRLTCSVVELKDSQAKPLAPSLVVLPFRGAEAGLSADMHDQLIRRLTHAFSEVLRVMPASMTADEQCMTDALGVVERLAPDFYLGGRCAWVNATLELSVELVRASDHVVMHTRAMVVRDVDEAAETIVYLIAQRIPGMRFKSESCSSYPLALAYLNGRMGLQTYTPQSLHEAVQSFRQCVRLDESYAPPWSGLAEAWLAQSALGLCAEDHAIEQASIAINRALALEPGNHAALLRLALLTSFQGSVDAAEALFHRALLSGDCADAHYNYAWHQWFHGREARAAESIETSLLHDPGSVAARILQLRIVGHRDPAAALVMIRQALSDDLADHPVILKFGAILASNTSINPVTDAFVHLGLAANKPFDFVPCWPVPSLRRPLSVCLGKSQTVWTTAPYDWCPGSGEQKRWCACPAWCPRLASWAAEPGAGQW